MMEEKELLEEILRELKLARYDKEDNVIYELKRSFREELVSSTSAERPPFLYKSYWESERFCDEFIECMLNVIKDIETSPYFNVFGNNEEIRIEKLKQVYTWIDRLGTTDDIKLLFKLKR